MAPSARKVHFQVDDLHDSKIYHIDEKDHSKINYDLQNKRLVAIPRKPSFQKSRFESLNYKQSIELSIKEQHRPDLKKLSLTELKDLLKKQEQIVHNNKLLLNLKDKGEKVAKFYQEIKEEIQVREKKVNKVQVKTEQMLEELSIKEKIKVYNHEKKASYYEGAYSENRARLFNLKHPNKRFNLPAKSESTIKVESHRNPECSNREVSIKIELPRAIKTLNYEESLQRLELANRKEKDLLCEQTIQFYHYRTRDDESGESDDSYDSDDSNDLNHDDDDQTNSVRINLINHE